MVKGKQNTVLITLIVIIVLSVGGLAVTFFSSQQLKQEVTTLQSSSQQLTENFNVLKTNFDLLKEENNLLKEENKLVKKESSEVSAEAEHVQEEVDKTLDELKNFEITVQESIDWFRRNNNVDTLSKYDGVKEKLKEQCVERTDTCIIDLTCINEVNTDEGFKYGYDDYATGREDFLKDLDKIYSQRGGDCEDFSLLFTAEYNYLKDHCLADYSQENVKLKAKEQAKNKVHQEDAPYIDIEGSYMYTICGNFDPGQVIDYEYAGHCLVAITNDPIQSSNDVYDNIKKSTLVEPQNGFFQGIMGETDMITIFPESVAPDTLHFISMVITDDDLMIYDEHADDIVWEGYEDFLKKAETLKKDVEK